MKLLEIKNLAKIARNLVIVKQKSHILDQSKQA